MYDDYSDGGRWITINGRHVYIDTSKYMNSFIKGKGYDTYRQKQGDERFEELKKMYPNAQVNELYGGYEEIAIGDQDLIDEFAYNYETGESGRERGYYNDTTQKILNEMPVSLNTRWRSDWDYQNHQSHYIYRNRKDLMKAIKNFGGIEEYTDHGKIPYSITSESGIGEYYLVRDKYAKGGWKWEDCNGDEVKGLEKSNIGRNIRSSIIKKDEQYIKEHGVDKYIEVFGQGSYDMYLELKEEQKRK